MANEQTASASRKWYLVDATGMTMGRLASQVAAVLRGKNKPEFTPHMTAEISLSLSTPIRSFLPATS